MEPFSVYKAQKSKTEPEYCGDCYSVFKHGGNLILIVSDGVSSCINDHQASKTACQTIEEYYNQSAEQSPEVLMSEAVKYASRVMNARSLAATAVIVDFSPLTSQCYYTNIGDTRLYHYNGREVCCLTEDDNAVTIVQRDGKPLFTNGTLVTTNKGLTKALGDNRLTPKIRKLCLDRNESIILLTDGISGNGTVQPQFFDFIHKSNPNGTISSLTVECSNSNRDDATMLLLRRNDFDDNDSTEPDFAGNKLPEFFFGHFLAFKLHRIIMKSILDNNNDTVSKCIDYAITNSLDIAELDLIMNDYAKMTTAKSRIFNSMRDLLSRIM